MEQDSNIIFIPDEEITLLQRTENETGNDLLNTSTYVDALERCIFSAPTDRTFTIGLFGEWGSGKSSIVKTAQKRLEAQAELNRKNVKFVTYDAWKYAGDSFRRMFLFELKRALGFEENELMQRFYSSETDETEIKTNINGKRVVLAVAYSIFAIIILVLLGIIAGWKTAIPSGVALVALGFSLYTWIFDNLKVSINKPLLFAPEQFEDCYHDMLNKAMKRHNWLQQKLHWVTKGRYNKELSKLIIIIDNIDRCQPDVTYSLLSDIKSFLGDSQDVIFIVPVDVDALRKHIVDTNKRSSHDADEFLRKFFNVSIWIKSYQNDEMYDFTQNLNQKYSLELNPTSVSVISREFATNPRRIIQLLNNLVVEFTHYSQDFLGKYQALVCLLAIIREEYPDDMKLIVQNPVLLFDHDRDTIEDEKNPLSLDIRKLLHKTRSVFENLYESREVLDQIISNSNVFVELPPGTEDALYTSDMQALRIFLSDGSTIDETKLALLKRCLCDRIKKAVDRGTYIPDLSNYMRTVIEFHKEELYTREDYEQLNNIIHKIDAWDNIVSDLMPKLSADLSDLAVTLFGYKLTDLRGNISSYIKSLDLTKEKLSESKVNSVLNVCQRFTKQMLLKPIKDQFVSIYNLRSRKTLEQSYVEPRELFSDELAKKVIAEIKADDFGFEETANWQFQQICKQTNPQKGDLLDEYLRKVTEVMPDYSGDDSQNGLLIQVLTDVNMTIAACPSATLSSSDSISGFIGKLQKMVSVSDRYGRSEKKSLYKAFADKEECLDQFITLLRESGKLYTADLFFSEQLMTFLLTNELVGKKTISTLRELTESGCPVEKYVASIADYSTLSDPYLRVLHYCFNNPATSKPRIEDSGWIKARIEEILNAVIEKGNENLAQFLKTESESETINNVLTECLSALDLLDLEKLPIIRDKAVRTFEQHIEDYKDNQTVLSIIGRCGTKSGIHALIRIIVNKLTGHQEAEAIELIKTLRYCNATDRKLINSTIESIEESIINQSSREEITQRLEEIKET
ncbi:MAG: hypothetical protein KBT13_07910 [Bacteroidales bacterium]|nr:hypothetical protein [Candidatus Sodaliphilus limicaballi]